MHPDPTDVAYTLDERRSRHAHVVVVSAQGDLAARLEAFAGGAAVQEGVLAFERAKRRAAKVAFAFSGQGGAVDSAWAGRSVSTNRSFAPRSQSSTRSSSDERATRSSREIERPEGESRLDETVVVQPAIAAIQVALTRLFAHYGLVPDGVVGHSIGEVAAAHAAGALTLEQAVAVIRGRSVIQDRASGAGRMLAVGLAADEAERMVAPLRGLVEIATINGPKAITLAGDGEPLEQIAKILEKRGVFARFVNVKVPYHSRFMDPLEPALIAELSPFGGAPASLPLYSTVTAQRGTGTHLTGQYWFDNVRRPVRYADTVRCMLDDGYDVFIEIGPHPVLVSGTRETAAAANVSALTVPSMVKKQDARDTFAIALASARAAGSTSVSAEGLHGGVGRLVSLPRYPFQRRRCWFETRTRSARARGASLIRSSRPARTSPTTRAPLSRSRSTRRRCPRSETIALTTRSCSPATGHIEVAHAVAAQVAPHIDAFLEDLRFEQPVVLTEGEELPPDVQFELTTAEGDYAILTRPAGAAEGAAWTRCSRGRINTFGDAHSAPPVRWADVSERVRGGSSMDVARFYSDIQRAGLTYGESFRCVKRLWHRANEITAELRYP